MMHCLNHPNIVATHEIPKQFIQNGNNLPVLCMEYCNKGDLISVNIQNNLITLIKFVSNIIFHSIFLLTINISHRC